jgi:hypothetical protein
MTRAARVARADVVESEVDGKRLRQLVPELARFLVSQG